MILSLLVPILFIFTNSHPNCLNYEKTGVDWYIILLYRKKYGDLSYYSYIDSNKKKIVNELFDKNTFAPFYLNDFIKKEIDTVHYINYSSNSSKGILISDSEFGVFLSHTLDNFPFGEESDLSAFVISDYIVTQFLCITLNKDGTNDLARAIFLTNPEIISSHKASNSNLIPDSFLDKLLNKEKSESYSKELITHIRSYPNECLFTVFTKTENSKEHPLEIALRNYYQSGFFVKSSSSDIKYSDCSYGSAELRNVNTISYYGQVYYMLTSSDEDKTKWLVSPEKDIVCIGDLERNEKILNNTGIEFCFFSSDISSFLKNSISSYVNCDGQTEMNINYEYIEEDEEGCD